MMWVATERAAYLVIGLLMFAVAAYVAWRLFGHVQTRVVDLARPVERPPRLRLPDRPGAVRAVRRRHRRHRPRAGQPRARCPRRRTTSSSPSIGEEMGLFGGAAVLMAYVLLIGAGLRTALRTDNTFEKLLSVGPDDDPRRAGVHHHRRRHQGRAADRHHAAVRQLRRLVAAVELHPAGPAHPAQRLRAPAASTSCPTTRRRRSVGRPTACAAAPVSTIRSWSDEPPDPPARRRPDGLLRRAVRRPQLLAGRAPAGAQRQRRQHPGRAPRVRAAPRADRHRRRRRRRPVGGEPAGQRLHVPAPVPHRRPVRQRHRLLHVRLRVDRAGAHPERRAHRRHARAAAAQPARASSPAATPRGRSA